MFRTVGALALVCAVLPACSIAGRSELASSATLRQATFDDGVRRMEAGETRVALDRLATVAAMCPVDGPGRRSLLLMAALELDPGYAQRRPDVAAQLAAFQLARPSESERWVAPLAREIYTIALDYGATPIDSAGIPDASVIWAAYFPTLPDSAGARLPLGVDTTAAAPAHGLASPPPATGSRGGPLCEVGEPRAGVVLPRLTGAPVVTRAQANGSAAPRPATTDPADTRALMAEVERLRGELARKEQELDRIRRTLRP